VWRAGLLAVLVLMVGAPALACTICHSPTSMGVRHQVFEHDFLSNAAALAAPIPILLAAVFALAREPRKNAKGTGHGR
jgi:hypothetical protein